MRSFLKTFIWFFIGVHIVNHVRQSKGQLSKAIQNKVVTRALSVFKMTAGRHFEYRDAPGDDIHSSLLRMLSQEGDSHQRLTDFHLQ